MALAILSKEPEALTFYMLAVRQIDQWTRNGVMKGTQKEALELEQLLKMVAHK